MKTQSNMFSTKTLPLAEKQLRKLAKTATVLRTDIKVDFDDLVHYEIEWLNDYAEAAIIGDVTGFCLADIIYRVVGGGCPGKECCGGYVRVRVETSVMSTTGDGE